MIRIGICDDEIAYREQLKEIVLSEEREIQKNVKIAIYSSAVELSKAFESGEMVNILFLDIELGNENGIDTAKMIKQKMPEVILIYISSHYDYVFDIFSTSPFEFIKKPFDLSKVKVILRRAINSISNVKTVQVHHNKIIENIRVKDIMYIENQGRRICIHISSGFKITAYDKLENIETEIVDDPDTFLRIHKSFIVNFTYIRRYEYQKVVLWNGTEINISKRYRNEVRDKYMNYKCDK